MTTETPDWTTRQIVLPDGFPRDLTKASFSRSEDETAIVGTFPCGCSYACTLANENWLTVTWCEDHNTTVGPA